MCMCTCTRMCRCGGTVLKILQMRLAGRGTEPGSLAAIINIDGTWNRWVCLRLHHVSYSTCDMHQE